jgi:hypothetical protein
MEFKHVSVLLEDIEGGDVGWGDRIVMTVRAVADEAVFVFAIVILLVCKDTKNYPNIQIKDTKRQTKIYTSLLTPFCPPVFAMIF